MNTLLKIGAVMAALLSTLIGLLFFSTAITRSGFYRWLAEHHQPWMIGLTPAQHYGLPWKYTLQELYQADLSGQKAIVTGANSGVGYEAALAMGRLGAEVTLGCRNSTKCQMAANAMREDPKMKGTVLTKTIDMSSLASVRTFALEYLAEHQGQSLDILLLNAGTAFFSREEKCVPLSEDGIESVFQQNYVSHHLLYRMLEGMLQKSSMARVVQTSSCSSFDTYTYIVATDLETLNGCSEYFLASDNLSYGQSKLAQILWAKKLSRMHPDGSIYYNSFHPGQVDTPIWDKGMDQAKVPDFVKRFINWYRREAMWTPEEGALTGMFLIAATDRLKNDNIRGKYYHPIAQEVENPMSMDEDLQDRLWEFSEALIKDFLTINVPESKEEGDDEEEELA